MLPLISVIIPYYNSEKTIEACILSVINQTYKNIEIITINDGSVDNSEYILDELSLKTQIPIIQIKQVNKGVSAARNTGIKNANGQYIALLDSDDIWKKDKIEKQFDVLQKNTKIALVATNKDDNNIKNLLGIKFKSLMPISLKLMLLKNLLLTSTVLFKKEIIKNIGYFDEKMRYSEDLDFFCRISAKHTCYLLNQSMVNAWGNKPAYGHSGLSANLWKMQKGELYAIRKQYTSKNITGFRFLFYTCWSLLKFSRRYLKTLIRF